MGPNLLCKWNDVSYKCIPPIVIERFLFISMKKNFEQIYGFSSYEYKYSEE